MTAETLPAAAEAAHTPGHCADHPDVVLVTRRAAGFRTWATWDDGPAVVCRSCPVDVAERCRWCGGPLHDAGTPTWHRSDRKAYCSSRDRLRAFRAARGLEDAADQARGQR